MSVQKLNIIFSPNQLASLDGILDQLYEIESSVPVYAPDIPVRIFSVCTPPILSSFASKAEFEVEMYARLRCYAAEINSGFSMTTAMLTVSRLCKLQQYSAYLDRELQPQFLRYTNQLALVQFLIDYHRHARQQQHSKDDSSSSSSDDDSSSSSSSDSSSSSSSSSHPRRRTPRARRSGDGSRAVKFIASIKSLHEITQTKDELNRRIFSVSGEVVTKYKRLCEILNLKTRHTKAAPEDLRRTLVSGYRALSSTEKKCTEYIQQVEKCNSDNTEKYLSAVRLTMELCHLHREFRALAIIKLDEILSGDCLENDSAKLLAKVYDLVRVNYTQIFCVFRSKFGMDKKSLQ